MKTIDILLLLVLDLELDQCDHAINLQSQAFGDIFNCIEQSPSDSQKL